MNRAGAGFLLLISLSSVQANHPAIRNPFIPEQALGCDKAQKRQKDKVVFKGVVLIKDVLHALLRYNECDYVLAAGESCAGYTIKSIDTNSVILSRGKKITKLVLYR